MNSSGLGLQIVRNLVEIELKGSFELRNDGEFVTADIYCSRALMGA
jgi:two-component sensor histidine kinase